MPVADKENIFAALFKWGDVKSKEEDFYSKSLVLILKRLERYDVALTTSFLCSLFNWSDFNLDYSGWDISDHTGQKNKPDIIFASDGILAYVEVKVSRKPEKDQLIRYGSELKEEAKGRKTALFLLTRLGLDEDWGIPNRPQVSWVKVWKCLLEIERRMKQEQGEKEVAPEAYFLVRHFRQFLKEKDMGIDKVSKMVGPKSLNDLRKYLFLIRAGCKMAKLEGGEFGLDEDWFGWWFKEKRKEKAYWCGFYISNPKRIGLGVGGPIYRRLKNRVKGKPGLEHILKKFHWEDYGEEEKCGEFFFELPKDFISLQPEEQLKFVSDAVIDILKNAIGRKIAVK